MPLSQRPRRVLLTLACSASLTGAVALAPTLPASAAEHSFLTVVDRFQAGEFDDGGAEIPAFDPETGRFFVTNGSESAIDVLELVEDKLERVAQIDIPAVTSIAVSSKGVLAVAVPADPEQQPGQVWTFDAETYQPIATYEVGALPDMLTWTADGSRIVVANEGEPSGYEPDDVDPEGSVSIIDVADGQVRTADFQAFNGREVELNEQGIRIFGPEATVAQDLEPEYIALSADGRTAYVALQENNALAYVDLDDVEVTDIVPLGLKDHSRNKNGLDASNRDGGIDIRPRPVRGMYMPDGIDTYVARDKKEYVVTANEGDGRDYDGFTDEARVGDDDVKLSDDFGTEAEREALQQDDELGRLKFSITSPQNEAGEYTELHTYGARSFSIRDADGDIVFDSADAFEQITAREIPEFFNSTNDDNDSFDDRSDDKGPEPEGVEIGQVGKRTYAFVGLERVGGIMVYDISNPRNAKFVDYVVTREFGADATTEQAGDLAPEGLVFVPADDSPTGEPLLVVAHEVSGTTTVFTVG